MKVIIVVVLFCGVTFAAPNKQIKFRNLYKEAVAFPIASHKPSGRIINGEIAEPHSIPYQAFLEVTTPEKGWWCGGSLISTKIILTAGHCVYGAENVKIVLGAQKPLVDEDSQIVINSSDVVVHEEYDMDFILNDIGLIKLPTSVELNDNIQTVKIATDNNQSFAGETGRVSGWGVTDGHGTSLSDELRYTENTILTNKECTQIIGTITLAQMCLSGDDGHSSCNGDSGGPLTVGDVQVGIVSYGVMYCPSGYPTVFTRVSSHANWIAKNSE